MNFTEKKLKQAVIEFFSEEGYKHLAGEHIHKEMSDVLLRDDLAQYSLISNENEYDRIFRHIKNNPCNRKPDTLNGCVGNCIMETSASEGEL